MGAKLGAAAICLAVVLVFGGTGVFASWAIATMLYDASRSREWTAVQADVEKDGYSYRYRFEGREYHGERWGLMRVEGRDNIDNWYGDMRDLVRDARKAQRPITVYVNPADPSEALIDRHIRWNLVLFLTPFALAFGGVGVGGLWMMQRVFRDAPAGEARPQAKAPATRVASDVRGALLGSWLFAFFWNAMAMPVGFLFVPDALRRGEWLALLVLLFPLVGVMLLWYAIHSTIGYLRRGAATLNLLTAEPRPGAPLRGSIEFARGVSAGDAFRVELECFRTDRRGDETDRRKFWSREAAVQAVGAGDRPRIDFSFDVPASVPASSTDTAAPVSHAWRIEARPAGQRMAAGYGFDLALLPALPVDKAIAFANSTPVPDEVKEMFERLGVKATDAEEREALAGLKPEERQALAKYARYVPSMKKIVIAIVCIVVAIQLIPVVMHLIHLVNGMGSNWE